MITEAAYTMTCRKCNGTIEKGVTIDLTSGNRASHRHGCPETKPTAAKVAQTATTRPAMRRPVLDSYEQECEDEGIKMGYRSY